MAAAEKSSHALSYAAMLKKKYDAVIAGAGPAGLLAANVLADSGASVLLLEADRRHMGGNGIHHIACLLNATDAVQARETLQSYRYRYTPGGQHASGRVVAAAEMQKWSLEKLDAFAEAVPALLRQLKAWGIALRAVKPAARSADSDAAGIATCTVAPADIRILPQRYRRKLRKLSRYALFNRVHIPQSTVHDASRGSAYGVWSVTAELLRYFFDYPWRLRSMRDSRACDGAALVGQLIVRLLDRDNVSFVQYGQLSNIHFSHRHVMAVDFTRAQEHMSVETGRLILATGDHLQDMDYAQSVFGNRFAALQSRWHTQQAGAGLADGVELAELAGAQCVRMHEVYGRLVHAPVRQDRSVPEAVAVGRTLAQPGCLLMDCRGHRVQARSAAQRLKVYERAFHTLHAQCEKRSVSVCGSDQSVTTVAAGAEATTAITAATEPLSGVPSVQLDLLDSGTDGADQLESEAGCETMQPPSDWQQSEMADAPEAGEESIGGENAGGEIAGSTADETAVPSAAGHQSGMQGECGEAFIAPLFAVFDSRFRETRSFGALLPAVFLPDDMLPAAYWQNLLYKADTPAELAASIGIDPTDVERALAAHNRLAKEEQAAQAQDAVRHTVIGDAPFYAAPVFPGHAGCRGGIKTNADGQVLTGKGYRINGLYAVGGCAASVLEASAQDAPEDPTLPAAQDDVLEFTETLATAYRAALHAADLPLP